MPTRLSLPAPSAVHLHRAHDVSGPPPRVLFGLPAWSEDPRALAIAIELAPPTGSVPNDLAAQIAGVLPAPESLARGALLIILGEAPSQGGLVARVLQTLRRGEPVPRTARATALLARGYLHIGAARDEASGHDLVWGFAPS